MPQNRTDSERIAVIETTVVELKHNLLGNGQPGQIQVLHRRVSDISDRVSDLENWKWWVLGGAGVIGALGGYFIR